MIVFFLQLNEDGSGDNWGAGDIPEISEFFFKKSEIPFSLVMNMIFPGSHTDNTIVTITKMGNEFIASTDLPKVNM